MSPVTAGIVSVALIFFLIFMGMPLFLCFFSVGFLGLWYFSGIHSALYSIGMLPYANMSNYAWTVVPLFVFMGFLALHAGLAEEFYAGVRKWLGYIRGGLAVSVIMGNVAFGACTGDGISAAVTFTTMSLPEMRKYGYADSLTLGSIAAGSLLSPIIPPSLPFIIIGGLIQFSVARLFIAGIFPGLLLAFSFLILIYILCRLNPSLGPSSPKTTFVEKLRALPGVFPITVIFIIIIGGLYIGLFTPTEAGAAGVFIVLVLGLVRRKLTWNNIRVAAMEAGLTTAMVGFLLIGCMQYNSFLAFTGLPQSIATLLREITSPSGFLWIMTMLIFVLGCFFDGLSMTVLTVPILYPVAISLGINPIHFVIVTSVMWCVGGLTPPFGMIVFSISGIVKDVPIFSIFRAVAPFLIAFFICQAILIHFPIISTFLPNTMMGK